MQAGTRRATLKVATPMVSTIRRFARPLSALLLLVFLAPAAAVECKGSPLGRVEAMDCCHHASEAPAMDPNCCAMRQQVPERTQLATPLAPRSSDPSLSAGPAPAAVPVALTVSLPTFGGLVNTGPPPFDSLYHRLSAIRR